MIPGMNQDMIAAAAVSSIAYGNIVYMLMMANTQHAIPPMIIGVNLLAIPVVNVGTP